MGRRELRGAACNRCADLQQSAAVYFLVLLGLAAAVVLFLVIGARNANRLLIATVRNGRLVRFKGHAPKKFVRDLEDVLSLRPVSSAQLRIVVLNKVPTVQVDGDIEQGELQRLRNVMGTWQVAKIRSAPYRSGGSGR